MAFIFQWIDGVWLLIALVLARKGQRLPGLAFVGGGMLMMRLQIELFAGMGHSYGFLGLLPYHIFYRGLAAYSFGYLVYIMLARLTRSRGVLLMATAMSIFFAMFFVSTIAMVL